MKIKSLLPACLLIAALAICAPPTTGYGDVLVIANKSVNLESLPRSVVADIYTNKKTKWETGDSITVVLQVKGKTHKTFASDIVKVKTNTLRQLWKKVIFSGSGKLPVIVKTDENVVNAVSATEGAIGYIDSSTPHENVLELTVTPD